MGTHLWQLNGALRLNDGNKLVAIPLEARFRKAVWDYLDEHQRQHDRDEEAHRRNVCSRREGLVHGLDEGTAAPTGSAERGTRVIEGTRSEPDVHGVFEATVMIEGVKKKARSSFFPSHWTIAEIETAIDEAYRNRKRMLQGGRFTGSTSQGLAIEMIVDPKGQIQTAYPVYGGAK